MEIQHSNLKSRLRKRQSQGGGLSGLLTSATKTSLSEEIELKMLENEKRLLKFPASWDAPRYYLDVIENSLLKPDKFIRIKSKYFNITKMGIVSSDKTSQSINTIHFNEILIADVLERVVVIVRYPRFEMLPKQEFNLQQ